MVEHAAISAAAWQTGTAVVQAVCSVTLLAWYVLAAHMDRQRVAREKIDDFNALVRLCHDLGMEAKTKTQKHIEELKTGMGAAAGSDTGDRLGAWRADMTIIYVCLNEVPHYEVRNPAFSTALTRLWLEVDSRSIAHGQIQNDQQVVGLLEDKLVRICWEVDAMAELLVSKSSTYISQGAASGTKRRGYEYDPEGFVLGLTKS